MTKRLQTLRKTSDTGPSFSDAVSSCLTFSSPLIIACISSANDFNCIYKEERHNVNITKRQYLRSRTKKQMVTLVAASRLTNSRWKSSSSAELEAKSWVTRKPNWKFRHRRITARKRHRRWRNLCAGKLSMKNTNPVVVVTPKPVGH